MVQSRVFESSPEGKCRHAMQKTATATALHNSRTLHDVHNQTEVSKTRHFLCVGPLACLCVCVEVERTMHHHEKKRFIIFKQLCTFRLVSFAESRPRIIPSDKRSQLATADATGTQEFSDVYQLAGAKDCRECDILGQFARNEILETICENGETFYGPLKEIWKFRRGSEVGLKLIVG